MLALVLAGGGAPALAVDDAAEPTAEALAAAWVKQRFGPDAVEVWTTNWSAQNLVYGVARRWKADKPDVLVRILKPYQYETLGFLLREVSTGLQVVYYRSPKLFPGGKKAARVMPIAKPDLIERLPFAPGLPAIGMLFPPRLEDFTFHRLPDQEMFGQACRVIEARMKKPQETWDTLVACLSRESGVALDTQWRKRDKLVRRVTSAPEDVKNYEGHWMPSRVLVEIPGQDNQEFRVLNLMIDPAMPDQLFAESNLKTGRFPNY
jgi:hypothetical protein